MYLKHTFHVMVGGMVLGSLSMASVPAIGRPFTSSAVRIERLSTIEKMQSTVVGVVTA